MKEIYEEIKLLLQKKIYLWSIVITAIASYGFAISQPMIGVDDSAIGRYFKEGLGPIMGRFGFFLLHKICPVAEYTPFIADFIGILFLILGATLWCIVLGKIIGKRLSVLSASVFSCVMISCPLMSEVFIYYLHNGVCLSYCTSALFVWYFLDGISQKGLTRYKKLSIALLLIWITNSFVEAFTIVFLMALAMNWTLQSIYKRRKFTPKIVLKEGTAAGIILALSIVLRTITIELITFSYSLQGQIGIMNRRSILEALDWFKNDNGFAEFVMTIKKYIAMYYVNAIAYIPIRIYVLAVICLFLYTSYRLVRHKQIIPILCAVMMQLIPLILVFLEGHATFYRNSQYIPLYVAFVVMLFTNCIENYPQKQNLASKVWIVAMVILIYNQAHEMTQWFYIDYMKYEDAKNTVAMISYDIDTKHDTSKPIVFVGNYTIPEHIVDKAYVDYDSDTYRLISNLLDIMDPNLKTCFAMNDGYSLSSESIYSVFTWGNIAFEGWDKETHQFFADHGHTYKRIMDPEICREIQTRYSDLPGWPLQGSIVEEAEYIIVKFK